MAESSHDMKSLVQRLQANEARVYFSHTVLEQASPEEENRFGLSLIGKIISDRPFSANDVYSPLKVAWSGVKEFLVEELATNLFLFHFLTEEE